LSPDQHVAGKIGTDNPGFGIFSSKPGGNLTGTAGQIKHPAVGNLSTAVNHEVLPPAILTEGHHPVHQVIAIGYGVEHLFNTGPFTQAVASLTTA
jgi:hypothetical protein